MWMKSCRTLETQLQIVPLDYTRLSKNAVFSRVWEICRMRNQLYVPRKPVLHLTHITGGIHMDRQTISPEIQKLAELDDPWAMEKWADYQSLGFTHENVPAMMALVQQTQQYWAAYDEGEEAEVSFWAPLHAWRALADLGVVDVAPLLLHVMDELADSSEMDLLLDDMPEVFMRIGKAALPSLIDGVKNNRFSTWTRVTAAESITAVARDAPETREAVVGAICTALEEFDQSDPTLNAFLIAQLAQMKATEAVPLVERAYSAGRVDQSVIGDWEDFQIEIGLLKHRITPTRLMSHSSTEYLPGKLLTPAELAERKIAATQLRKDMKKEKKKLAQAKAMRKGNKKKKKKK
jgi:hypothetical protein